MHILFLTDNFPPEVNAPASRTYEHCCEWVRLGAEVTVITCAPNFPQGTVYDGYKNRIFQKEIMDGITVIRVWTYITENSGLSRRILDYLSFMFSAIPSAIAVRNVDIVVGTSPQFFTACAAYFVALIRRKPWVFEVRDLWPDSIRAVGAMKPSRVLDFLARVEVFLYRRATRIVTVTHSFKRSLVSRGIPGDKIAVVTNGVDLSRFGPQPCDMQLAARLGLTEKFVAGYIGTHGMAHSLETLIAAAKQLEESQELDDFILLMLGDGSMKSVLRQQAKDQSVGNVIFLDSVPRDMVPSYWSLLDVAIVHLKSSALFETVIPSKLFECMAMGLPMVYAVRGESAEIVSSSQVGVLAEPEQPDSIVSALKKLHSDSELYRRCAENCLRSAVVYDRSKLAKLMMAELATAMEVFR